MNLLQLLKFIGWIVEVEAILEVIINVIFTLLQSISMNFKVFLLIYDISIFM